MAQAQVEREASQRCRKVNAVLKLPNSILAACYALNSSNTKRIIVGFEQTRESLNSDGALLKYELVLKFINAGGSRAVQRELIINTETWDQLQDHFDLINTYFTDEYQYYQKYNGQRTLNLLNHDMLFTTSYGSKSFLLEQRPQSFADVSSYGQSASTSGADATAADTDENSQQCKKMKIHLPSIVMQRITFEGLKSVTGCLNAHIERLREHTGNINMCVSLIEDYIRDILQQRVATEAERKNIVINENEFLKYVTEETINEFLYRNIKETLPSDFSERYFEIVYEEIMAFQLSFIREKIRKSMFS